MNDIRPPLSFVQFGESTDDKKINYWSVAVMGNWGENNARGRALADEYVAYMRKGGSAGTLHFIAKAMYASGNQRGVQVGFWTRVAEHLSQRP